MAKNRIKPIHLLSLLNVIILKIRFGSKIKLDIRKVFIHPSATVNIKGEGRIKISTTGGRVYISKGSSILASGGELEIGSGVFFNSNAHIVCHKKIIIGDDCMFGHNICIFDSDHRFDIPGSKFSSQGYVVREICIANNVWVGAGSVITKGTSIGSNVVVGANSVVRGSLDEKSLYAGNPVKRVRGIYE
ncbi:acyltransferase [Pantoea sp. At-9b]|uniref:acyltransferase n=1 Tax=Pantoea sp. (strain At-9b) TaxID=592316 RepID=UPI0001F2604C|nr:acyltransferase [Pantoea sp. At-9b]ADU72289.1 galactoside O-acetyltransferase [Pantoea sp. At-9b]